MIKRRGLLKAGGLYFIGNVFDKAIAFITIPIFTRLLSTSDYGISATYVSWMSIVTVFITLSLGNSIRTAAVDFPKNINNYISSIFSLGLISSIVITTLISFGVILFGINVPISLVLMCCANAFGTSIISAINVRYMMEIQYLKRTLLQCIPNLITVILSIVLINNLDYDKYLGRIFAYFIISTAIGCSFVIYYFIKGRTFYKRDYWSYALTFSIPLIFHGLSSVILSQSDRTMITLLYSSAETGLYSLAYQFGLVPAVFTTTFENLWIPWFTNRMEENDRPAVKKMVIPYVYLVLTVCIGVMLMAPEIIKFMSDMSYHSAVYMVSPICLATFLMFLASIALDLEYYKKETKHIAVNTVVAAATNIGLNLLLVPKYGGTAAAYTTVAAYFVSLLMHYRMAKKLEHDLFNFRLFLFPSISALVIGVLVNIIMELWYIRWGIAVIDGIVFCAIGYKFLKGRMTE